MSRRFAGRLAGLFRELGVAGAVSYAVYRLCAKTSGLAALHRYLLVVQPVPESPLLPPRRGRSIAVQRIDPRDAALLRLPLDEKVQNYRAGQGAVCFGAFKDGELVGCLWLCLGSYEEDEVRCRFHPLPEGRASWDFDVYLDPRHRSGLGFARLWDTANAFLRERGVVCSWSRISAFNAASLAAHARLGARVAGRATFFRLGPCQLMAASLPPYLHLSLGRHSRPDLKLAPTRSDADG